jgi:hypothetical protein
VSEDRKPQAPTQKPWGDQELPDARGAVDPYTTADYLIGIDAYKASATAYKKNAATMQNYRDLPLDGLSHPDDITDTSIDHMANNLVFLHDEMVKRFGQRMVNRARLWHNGINKIAKQWAGQVGFEMRQVAAAMANISPQKDWSQIVSLANRMMSISRNQQETTATPEMMDWLQKYSAQKHAEASKLSKKTGRSSQAKQDGVDQLNEVINVISRPGVRFGDINDPYTRAVWLRAYDEAHNPREYVLVSPEGEFGEPVLTDKNVPCSVTWGSFAEIQKAMEALEGKGDLPSVSRSLGENHMVRSLYNNIVSPASMFGDTMIDTYAVAAAHMMPFAGEDPEVKMGLGVAGSSSSHTGCKGAYGIYHEAYQKATRRINARDPSYQLLPHELQSITSEGLRGLFNPKRKRDDVLVNDIRLLWNNYRFGKATADETRAAVVIRAGGMDAPKWWTKPLVHKALDALARIRSWLRHGQEHQLR